MSALDKRLSDLAQIKKALLMRLESVEREIQETYRLRYDTLNDNRPPPVKPQPRYLQ